MLLFPALLPILGAWASGCLEIVTPPADGSSTTSAATVAAPTPQPVFGFPSLSYTVTDGSPASAMFAAIWGIVYDASAGALYIGDVSSIRKYTLSTGQLVTLAGTGYALGYVNGIGPAARLTWESAGMVKVGNALYFAEDGDPNAYWTFGNCAIRKLDLATLQVSTLAGPGPSDPAQSCGFADGSASAARFRFRNQGAALTSDGTYLYVADSDNHAIRRVALSDGTTTTIAGGPPPTPASGTTNATGTSARFYYPYSVFYRASNNTLIVGDGCNAEIRVVDLNSSNNVTTLLANGAGYQDGNSATAKLGSCSLRGGVLSSDGNTLYIADGNNYSIRAINLNTAAVTTVAGKYPTATYGFADGTGTSAILDGGAATLAIVGNTLYFNNWLTLRTLDLTSLKVSSIDGLSPSAQAYADAPGTQSRFNYIYDIELDGLGSAYVVDEGNQALRKVDLGTWNVATVAGAPPPTPATGFADGSGSAARFNYPFGAAVAGGKVYVVDSYNCAIRKYDPSSGNVATVAGAAPPTAACGFVNAQGNSARFNYPSTAVALGGALYVVDNNNNAIRKIDLSSGNVTTLAGSSTGTGGYQDGTGGAARFSSPWGIRAGIDGKLYVTDSSNNALRRIDPASGAVVTVAGPGAPSTASGYADGTGSSVRFNWPGAIISDATGSELFIFDYYNGALRKYDVVSGQVSTVLTNPFGESWGGALLDSRTLLLGYATGAWTVPF